MVRQQYRLCFLQMSIAGDNRCFVGCGQFHQRTLQLDNMADGVQYRVPGVEPDIERHLVVAAARGVQFFPGIADFFNQTGFDIHMDVFQFRFELEFACGDFFSDTAQSFDNGFRLPARVIMPCLASILACAMLPAIS